MALSGHTETDRYLSAFGGKADVHGRVASSAWQQLTDAVEKVVNDLTKPFRWSIFGPVFVSAGVSELNARPTALGWTPLTLRRRMQPGCSAMVARYNWRVSSSSARWRQGGIRRVHRKGPATAYARNCGASSGAQSASRPSCARCGIWRT